MQGSDAASRQNRYHPQVRAVCGAPGGGLRAMDRGRYRAGDRKEAKACAHWALDLAQTAGRPYDERLARRILDGLEAG